MLFNSYIFIFVFLPLVLLGYYVLGGWRAKVWLVGASLLYYGWWNPAYLLLILGSMGMNFGIGRILSGRPRRWVLGVGIVINLLLLGYYKYAGFFVENMNVFFGMSWTLREVILPLAISFFTFQQIAFLVDAYRGEVRGYNFLDYMLFVTFFPQLIAGPIVHHKEMMPQFEDEGTYRFCWEKLSVGFTCFTIGLFKKVMIADHLSEKVRLVYGVADSGGVLLMGDAWLGTLCYAFQIYFDFSGYCDMAIGLGLMFGIVLPLNFNSPYKAVHIVDFWRRWHMTLSRFLRDYLYIPLGGNRKGYFRRYVNLVVTMVLGGLWHGAGWGFALWGLLHGVYLVISHVLIEVGRRVDLGSCIWRWVGRVVTLLGVVLAWVLFRAESLGGAYKIYEAMFGGGASAMDGVRVWIKSSYWVSCGVLLMLVWVLPNTQEVLNGFVKRFEVGEGDSLLVWRPGYVWSVGMGVLLTVCVLSLNKVSEFLYYQF